MLGTVEGRGAGGSSSPAGAGSPPSDSSASDEEAARKKSESEAKRKEIERLKEEARKREDAERKAKELPARIVLVSPDGIEQSVGARVVFGRVVLAKFGEAAKYANDRQFILERTGDEWFLEACEGTANDTMVNGSLVEGGTRVPLAIGDTIAIGKAARKKTVLELTVRKG
jgi:hypothetical protein